MLGRIPQAEPLRIATVGLSTGQKLFRSQNQQSQRTQHWWNFCSCSRNSIGITTSQNSTTHPTVW